MSRTALRVRRSTVDESGMATSTIIGIQDNGVRIPRSTDNGLWNALASRVAPAPVGSGLVVFDVRAFSAVEPAVRPAA
jgi:hypothetical protein